MTVNTTKPRKPDILRAEKAIEKIIQRFPEVTESGPWGHRAFKIRNKTFLFLVADGDGLSLSVKLPLSGAKALKLPFAEPTGYGLGKSGWVSAAFKPGSPIPLELIAEWLEESFAAIAPKKLTVAKTSASASKATKPAKVAKGRPPTTPKTRKPRRRGEP